jgi:hypothetical protein
MTSSSDTAQSVSDELAVFGLSRQPRRAVKAREYFVREVTVISFRDENVLCAVTRASTAVSSASLTPSRLGIASKYPPYAHSRLYLRSFVKIASARACPRRIVGLLGAVLTRKGGLFSAAGLLLRFGDRLRARAVGPSSINLYRFSPAPIHSSPRRAHRVQIGFTSSHCDSQESQVSSGTRRR